jgi:hypothetical protein
MANIYSVDLEDDLTDIQKREYVKNFIHFLKRKGTYTSLLILWKTLTNNTTNYLNIYERWHPYNIPVDKPISYFEDFLYTSNYEGSVPPTGGAGKHYYESQAPSAYPNVYGPGPSGMALSTHYKVEMDLSNEPMGEGYIINETELNTLIENWELLRPATRVSHYHGLLAPETDFTGDEIDIYDTNRGSCKSRCCQSSFATSGSSVTLQRTPAKTWTVKHFLGDKDPIVVVFNSDFEQVVPEIIITSSDEVELKFAEPVEGSCLCAKPQYKKAHILPSSTWISNHILGEKNIISQYSDLTHERIVPSGVYLNSPNKLTTYVENTTGYGSLVKAEYKHVQTIPSKTWTINHNLGIMGVATQFFTNSNFQIWPSSFTLVNRNKAIATFDEPVNGYAISRALGTPYLTEQIMSTLNMTKGYWEIGTGKSGQSWNPVIEGGLESPIFNGTFKSIEETSDYFYINFSLKPGMDINLTEIGLFNSEGLAFYTYHSPLHVSANVIYDIHYRLKK